MLYLASLIRVTCYPIRTRIAENNGQVKHPFQILRPLAQSSPADGDETVAVAGRFVPLSRADLAMASSWKRKGDVVRLGDTVVAAEYVNDPGIAGAVQQSALTKGA